MGFVLSFVKRVRRRVPIDAKTGYLPTLDGWRAIAVLLVTIHHDSVYSALGLTSGWLNAHGAVGVDIFFGISGLLICSRLLDEERATGRIDLRSFYIRRAFRIVPPALIYLLLIAVLAWAGVIIVLPKEWFGALLYYRNYGRLSMTPGFHSYYTGHFWSLAIEEHFYLILPGILALAPKRWRVPILAALVGVVGCWRVYRQQTRPWVYLQQHTDTRLDALLVPALFAIALGSPSARKVLTALTKFWPGMVVLVIALLSVSGLQILKPFGLEVLIPLILIGTVTHNSSLLAFVFELPPIKWLGRISYSLYLWQPLFFVGHFLPWSRPLGFLQDFPARWGVLLACATISYYFLEKPLMAVGHRLAPPITPGRVVA